MTAGALKRSAAALLLVCLVAWVYAASCSLGFAYDDRTLILDRRAPAGIADVARALVRPHWPDEQLPYYRPIPGALLQLQRLVHGDVPRPFHVLNVALICAAALLARGFLAGRAVGLPPAAAWLGAALFAVHPIAASVVHPISGREALLSGLFAIAALELHLEARGGAGRAGAALLFAAALFTREHAVVVPLLFALADLLGLSRELPRKSRDWLLRQLPLAAILTCYALARNAALEGQAGAALLPPRLAWLPLAAPLFALRASLLPGFQLVYEPRPELWLATGRTLLAAAGGALFVALGLRAARCEPRLGRRLGFLLGFFLLTLLPSANLLRQEAEFADRFAFLPLLALVGAAGLLVQRLVPAGWRWRLLAVAAGAAVALCAAMNRSQAASFRDEESFLLRWVESDPGYAKAHYSLGQHWMGRNRSEDARAEFERALELEPNYPAAHNNLGALAFAEGDFGAARAHWDEALRWDPRFTYAINNLAALQAARGDLAAAAELYRRSLDLRPGDARVKRLLAAVLRELRAQRPPSLPPAVPGGTAGAVDGTARPPAGSGGRASDRVGPGHPQVEFDAQARGAGHRDGARQEELRR